MRETSFIKQNKDKWAELEELMEQKEKDPEKLNELFVKVTDDLSYSRTYYPNRSVRVYLNGLAQRIFYSIYKNRRGRASRFINFWKEDLPVLVYESRKAFRLSFGLFMLAMCIGVISSIYDADFPRAMLSDSYIEMTLENIESGDPMAVYKSKGQFSMAFGITVNNIWVAFRTFIMGIFFLIGSIAILFYNGVVIGAFQYFFFEQGLLQESALTIWMHGTLEISAIVIAGAAGITMGRGLVFPGTLSRAQAFQLSARRGIKIMIGITPLFILAGFIEGYLTRLTDTSDMVRLFFILSCLIFVIGYFVILPVIMGRQGKRSESGIEDLHPSISETIDLGKIKSSSNLFSDLFIFLRKHVQFILGISMLGATLYSLLIVFTGKGLPTDFFNFQTANPGMNLLGKFFNNPSIPLLPFINGLVFFLIAQAMLTLIQRKFNTGDLEALKNSRSNQISRWLKLLFISLCFSMVLYPGERYIIFITLLLSPTLFVWYYQSATQEKNVLYQLAESLALVFTDYWKGMGIFTLLAALFFLTLWSTSFSISRSLLDVVSWNIFADLSQKEEILTMVLVFLEVFIMGFFFSLFIVAGAILFHTYLEKQTAAHLKQKVLKIGLRHTIQGIEQETK